MGKIHTDDVGVIDIWSQGFGILPKVLMVDPGLSLGAKSLAAYFYSHAGAGHNTVFPARDTILRELSMDKEAYYKSIKELTDSGIVSVTRSKKARGGYAHNIYTLEPLPTRYRDPQQFKGFTKKLVKKAQHNGNIIAAGYGRIPGAVMTSGMLSWKAKTLYAYLCTFADTSLLVLPERTSTIKDLGISASTYERYLRELRAHQCISYETCQDHGRFCGTKIDLYPRKEDKQMSDEQSTSHDQRPGEQNPDVRESPRRQVSDAQNPDERKMPRRQKPDMQNPDEQSFPDGQASDTQKPDTIIPLFLTRPPFDNQSISPARTREGEPVHTEDGAIDREAILLEMADYGGLPFDYCRDRNKLEAAIKILTETDYDSRAEPADREFYNIYVDDLAEMLDASKPYTQVREGKVSYSRVCREFQDAIEAGYDDCGEPYAVAPELYTLVKQKYDDACKENFVRYPRSYLKRVIWTVLTTSALELKAQMDYDFKEGD